MSTGNGEKSSLKIQLSIAGGVISLLLVICGVLIQIGFDSMRSDMVTMAMEVKELGKKVSSLETAVSYMDRYGQPPGPPDNPGRTP